MFYGKASTPFEQDQQQDHHPEQPTVSIIGDTVGEMIAQQLAQQLNIEIQLYHTAALTRQAPRAEKVVYHADEVIAVMNRGGGWRLACQSGATRLTSMLILAFPLPDQPRNSESLLIQNLLAQGLIKPSHKGIELNDYPYLSTHAMHQQKKLLCAYRDNGQTAPSTAGIATLMSTIQQTI